MMNAGRVLILMISILFSITTRASELICLGEIDPQAAYTVTAALDGNHRVVGTAHVRYSDNDGFQFSAEIQPQTNEVNPGQGIHISGPVDGGVMTVHADYSASEDIYRGWLTGQGSLGEGIAVEILCTIKTGTP